MAQRIISKQVTVSIYIGDSGRESNVEDLDPKYLLNALLKAEREDNGIVKEVLMKEAIKRMQNNGEKTTEE